ncbi:MAG: tetratricopeptide repeat protein [Steroidobacteraceae bacterium]
MTIQTMTVTERPTLSIPQSMELAWRHHRAGSSDNAQAIAMRVLRVAPKNPDALHLLGILAYQAQNYPLAIKLISEAIRHAKKFPPMHGNLALAKLAVEDLAGAAMSARKAFALSPAYADAHRVLGLVHEKKGQYREAVEEFERAQALGLDNPELQAVLARARAQLPKT